MLRRLLIFGAAASVLAKAAQTRLVSAQLYLYAITANSIEILRPGGTRIQADLGPSLLTTQLQNPTRLQLDVDWTKAPVVPSGGFQIAPTQLVLTNGNLYVAPSAIPAKHLLFVNGIFNFPGIEPFDPINPIDYSFSGTTIKAYHPALLDASSKVVIVY